MKQNFNSFIGWPTYLILFSAYIICSTVFRCSYVTSKVEKDMVNVMFVACVLKERGNVNHQVNLRLKKMNQCCIGLAWQEYYSELH